MTQKKTMTKAEEPTREKYGWHEQKGFDDEPSGWMIEGGEEAYYEALENWKALHYANPDPSELLKEAVAVIERIANPIKFMQDNLKEGERLNGQMAIHICNDPEYLKNIAKEFLTKHSGRV